MISKKDNIMEFTTLFLSNVHEKYLELKKQKLMDISGFCLH